MADNTMKFDTRNLWTARDENGSTLQLSAFAGRTNLTVFRKGNNRPDVKVSVPTSFQVRWKQIIKDLLASNPGTRIPFIQQVYDPTTKSFQKNLTMTFIKTEKGVLKIEVSTPKSSQYCFNVRCSGSFSDGNPTDEAQRSVMGALELIQIIDHKLPVAEITSTFNLPPLNRGNGGNGGYGNNQNRPHQTNEGYRKQQTSNDPFAGGSDDIF